MSKTGSFLSNCSSLVSSSPSNLHAVEHYISMEETPSLKSEGNNVLRGRYELGRLLGHGTFAKVYLAKNLKTNTNVAIKVITKEKVIKIGMTEQIKREISVMKMVKHPNIVELHEVMATKSKIYFVMELVRGGELFSRIARNGRLPQCSARKYFQQLISAVDFCHSRGVYHRDLKPENLLVDENGNLKIADFGLSAFAEHVRPDGLLHTTCGTPAYVAPEVINKRGYEGEKADIWSCGVILFVLLAGYLPFQDDNVVSLYKKIQQGDFKCPSWISPEANRLITRLLDPNPKSRTSIAKLVLSSWYRKSKQVESDCNYQPVPKEVDELPGQMNAFHLISLSEGFDLSPLFDHENTKHENGSIRFTTRESARGVISRLEQAVERNGDKFRVAKSSGSRVRIEGGDKGRLAMEAEIFRVSPEVLVVEVKMDGGDALEYRRFCCEHIRPAIMDIVWASSDSSATIA